MKFTKSALIGLGIVFLCTAGQGGCDDSNATPSADQQQRQQQEMLSQRGNMAAGMPAITNFSEKKLMKTILELRDSMPRTWTYLYDMNGHVGDKVCDSVGYGLPYATEFTNPQKPWYVSEGTQGIAAIGLPQADPNGLFPPSSADGTWVVCNVPGTKDVKPLYLEPRVIVSPFPLKKD